MPLQITLLESSSVPLEVEGLVPDQLQPRKLAEIERMDVFQGNRKIPLAEFFSVSGDPTDGHVIWEGNLAGVHWIGAKMKSGLVEVRGDAGRHVGSEMSGGEIHVRGDAGDWVGGEMHGGQIHVRGDAGHLIGAAYRGSRRGMTNGTILIGGSAGNEIGHTMRRGLIAIGGNAGDLVGFNMIAGSVVVFGSSGIRHGAGMRRGTLAFLGPELPPILPSFRFACRFNPQLMGLLLMQLKSHQFAVPNEIQDMTLDLYHGDFIEGGRGEMLLRAA